MTMSVSALQISTGDVYKYTHGFRNLIENHLKILREDTSTKLIPLNLHDEYKYTGDFFQLLVILNVPQELFWITLRINGLHSSIDYTGNLVNILLPAQSTIDHLLRRYTNTMTLS